MRYDSATRTARGTAERGEERGGGEAGRVAEVAHLRGGEAAERDEEDKVRGARRAGRLHAVLQRLTSVAQ